MQEDVDTCRICSAPAEPNQPLYYPCKCSGTIRYIHQDCLTTWLQHSNKRHCDVCKHPYKFTKVYSPNMPDKLPVLLFLRRLTHQIAAGILMGFRSLLVASVWLILLPYATVWTWRFYFWLGDQVAWRIYAGPRPEQHPKNITEIAKTVYDNIPSDVFTGQIIACLIVLVFLAIFLLREWIAQHAQPGVFDDNGQADVAVPEINPEPVIEPAQIAEPEREPVVPQAPPRVRRLDTLAWAEQVAKVGADPPPPENTPEQPVASTSAVLLDDISFQFDRKAVSEERELPKWEESTGRLAETSLTTYKRVLAGPPPGVQVIESISSEDNDHEEDEVYSQNHHKRRRPAPQMRTRFGPSRISHGAKRPVKRHVRSLNALDLSSGEFSSGSGSGAIISPGPDGSVTSEGDADGQAKGKGKERPIMFRFGSDSNTPADGPRTPSDPEPAPFGGQFSFEAPAPTRLNFSTTVAPPLGTLSSEGATPGKAPALTLGLGLDPTSVPLPLTPSILLRPSSSQPNLTSIRGALHSRTENRTGLPSSSYSPSMMSYHSASASTSHSPFPTTPPPHLKSLRTPTLSAPTRRPTLPLSAHPSPQVEVPLTMSLSSSSAASASDSSSYVMPSPRIALYQPPEELSDGYFPLPRGSLGNGGTPVDPTANVTVQTAGDQADMEHYFTTGENNIILTNNEEPEPSRMLEIHDQPFNVNWTGVNQDVNKNVRNEQDIVATPMAAGPGDAELLQQEDPILMHAENAAALNQGDGGLPPLIDTDDSDAGEDEDDERRPNVDEAAPPAAEEAGDEPIIEEDMDGALEAIGIRGPLHAMFQNAVLMVIILDTTVGLGVWTPYTIGKTVALVALSPTRALYLLNLPIRVVRFITDPFVDLFLIMVRKLLFPFLLKVVHMTLIPIQVMMKMAWNCVSFGLSPLIAKDTLDNWAQWAVEQVSVSTGANLEKRAPSVALGLSGIWYKLRDTAHVLHAPFKPSNAMPEGVSPSSTLSKVPREYLQPEFLMHVIPTQLTSISLKENLMVMWKSFARGWVSMAHNDQPHDRVWTVVLGYAVVGLGAGLYLNSVTVDGVRGAGRAVRNVIRQQLIIAKVAFFIVIELAAFPLGCGILLDLCTLPIFSRATIETRLAFFDYAPVTATFYHWVIGTLFMYQFAVLLSSCREVMRPGAIWFIKDPQDPNYHPIRDILDRPTFSQIRKLMTSAVMYAIVIGCGIGAIVVLLCALQNTVLPLRWNMREPLSEIPIDLLFIHIVLPPTLRYFRPKRVLRVLITGWWRYAARQLRLTSYMFGTRVPDEEMTQTNWSLSSLIMDPWGTKAAGSIVGVRDGGFRRVPATDNIVRINGRRTVVCTDENGNGIDDESRETIRLQDEEAVKAHRDPNQDFVVIYAPPRFRERLILFNVSLWITLAFVFAACISAPIKAGRLVIALFTPREVHDGYAFAIGFYICWTVAFLRLLLERERRRWKKHLNVIPSPSPFPYKSTVRKGLRWIFRISWMIVILGIILPLLLAIVVDLYIVWPLRLWASHNTLIPTIHVAEAWAIGLIYAKIAVRSQRFQPPNDYSESWNAIKRGGWLRPDPWPATRNFFAPVAGGLLGMIFLPAALAWVLKRFFHLFEGDDKYLFHTIYPGIFILVSWAQLFLALSSVIGSWAQSIRDSEFLIEMRVRNLEKLETPRPSPAAIEHSGEADARQAPMVDGAVLPGDDDDATSNATLA